MDLTAFRLAGTNDGASQVSIEYQNSLLTAIEDGIDNAPFLEGAYPGGTTDFLRGDGAWAIPPGGEGGGAPDVYLVTDYGITEGNAAGANGSANSAAMTALLTTIRSNAANAITNYQGCGVIRFPLGYFEFSETIDLTDGTFTIEGLDTGRNGGARGTILKFPTGVTGIRVQRYNTSGATTEDDPTHRGGDAAIIRNLALIGAYTSGEAGAHGIHLRALATISDVYIDLFEGDGVHSAATAGGTPEGNSNNTRITGGRIAHCRNGLYIDGADANIWTIVSVDLTANRQWNVWDSSFLGNTYVGCHSDSGGLTGGETPTVVSYSGNRYGIISGQAAGASTNAPSGTTANNTWWYYLGSGGTSTANNIPLWTSGISVREGGSYHTDSANSRNCFIGCYHETGQGKSQLVTPTIVLGGNMATSVLGTASAVYCGTNVAVLTNTAFASIYDDGTDVKTVQLGEQNASNGTILYMDHDTAAPSTYRLKFSGNDIRMDYANSSSLIPFWITGPSTAQQFGTGAAVAHAFYAPKLMVGGSIANARQQTNGTAAPTTGAHAQGEIVFNLTPSAGGKVGWICVTAGTPGTWKAFGVIDA